MQLGTDGFFSDFPDQARKAVERATADEVLSPQNPVVLAGNAEANLPGSGGFEGLGYSPDRMTLYPMLEKAVFGDPEGSLRIYEFDVASQSFADELAGYYQMESTSHFIGDLTPINDNEFLVIERDGGQGETAEFKQIFKIDLTDKDESGFVSKELIVDLLQIQDPNDLNGDGETSFDFPFVTIEDVLVLDENTILVANDNNYPFSIGRGPDIDNTEMILLELPESLDLDPRLGQPTPPPPSVPSSVFGTTDADFFDTEVPDEKQFIGDNQILFAGGGSDFVDISFAPGGDLSRVDLGGGDDILMGGSNHRIIAGSGNDTLFVGSGDGNNIITGGTGMDQFWIVTDTVDLPTEANTITDFTIGEDVIGFGATSPGLSFNDLNLRQDGGNTIINALGQDLAILLSTQVSALSTADFVIV